MAKNEPQHGRIFRIRILHLLYLKLNLAVLFSILSRFTIVFHAPSQMVYEAKEFSC